MPGTLSHKESDGKSVQVDLLYEVDRGQIAVVQGWLGVMAEGGDSGDTRAMTVESVERQFTVPAGLTVNKGDIVYIDVTDVTGHDVDDTAWSTSAGSNKVAFFKATAAKDANNVVLGIVIPGNLAS
jgi:hypothetical protein